MNGLPAKSYDPLLKDIVQLLEDARRYAARTVNAILTATYWEIGRRIVEYEQGGESRAEYGEALLKRLSADLVNRFGRGFSEQNLEQMRNFYLAWPISQTLSAELSVQALSDRFPLPWSAYVRLISVKNENARRFYETEALRGGWSVRQLERKINSQFYERTALSKNKAAMLKKGARAKPEDTLMVESVDSAIRQVAEKVLEKAKQTHTLMVIWEDDQIKEIPPEEMEMRLNARLSLEASSWPVLYVVTIFWIRVIR